MTCVYVRDQHMKSMAFFCSSGDKYQSWLDFEYNVSSLNAAEIHGN